MEHKHAKTTEQWIDIIAHNELPAITSTALMLDKFSNDDKSSLPKLSEAILHDQALSSCLLKVANNIQHIGVNKVTTVSRATVILGVQAVKNICLTAKLVSSLLASKSLDFNVYNELTQLMANSFYAGMLAKMMVPHYSEEIQEEVYLAAMLYRIGETAFWSSGGQLAEEVAAQREEHSLDFDNYCEQQIGSSFNDLSRGLASTWNLSDLLIKALDQPTSRTDEIKTIYFADKLSSIIATPADRENEYNQLLESIADLMGINQRQLKVRIEHTREQACQLLSSYGVEDLTERLKELPRSRDFIQADKTELLESDMSKEKCLLDTFMKLTQLMKSSKDLNEYLQLTLIESVKAFPWQRCSFFMLVDDKKFVKSRFVYNQDAEKDPYKARINISEHDNVIARVLKESKPVLINDHKNAQWRDLFTEQLADLILDGQMILVPIHIGNKNIGVVCAQNFHNEQDISVQDFKQFVGLIEHLNMCLTMVMLR